MSKWANDQLSSLGYWNLKITLCHLKSCLSASCFLLGAFCSKDYGTCVFWLHLCPGHATNMGRVACFCERNQYQHDFMKFIKTHDELWVVPTRPDITSVSLTMCICLSCQEFLHLLNRKVYPFDNESFSSHWILWPHLYQILLQFLHTLRVSVIMAFSQVEQEVKF